MPDPQQQPRPRIIAPFQPLPWQVEPWKYTGPVMLLTGSGGGGKSRLASERCHAFAMRYPGSTVLMLRKNREAMTNSTVLFYEHAVVGGDPKVKHVSSKHRFEYWNGSIVAYGGMADREQREQIRSVGKEGGVELCWMEEATAFTEEDYNEIGARMRGPRAPWRQVVLSTNPDSPSHWIYQRLMLGLEARVFASSASDNTHNPVDYQAKLDAISGIQGLRLAKGLWVQAEGAVYDEFSDAIHVVDKFPIPPHWRRIRSVDFGYTNPFSCGWWALDPDGKMYRYRSIYKTRRLVEDHTRQIVELSRGEHIEATVADHDAEDRATMAKHGVQTVPAFKAIKLGIQAVQARLRGDGRGPRLFLMKGSLVERDEAMVHVRKPWCIEQEFTSYVWPKGSDGKPMKEVPVDEDNHACLVAGTHVETARGEVPIERVQAGDEVLTRNGWRPVLIAGMTAESVPVFEVQLSNGATLTGTGNHPIFVQEKGFAPLISLMPNDMVYALEGSCRNLASTRPKPSSTGASSSVGIRSRPTGQTGCIFRLHRTSSSKVSSDSIRRSGRMPTGQSRPTITSTTRTTTPSTTPSRIWSASPLPITAPIMAPTSPLNDWNACARTCWSMPSLPPQNGTDPRLDMPGTARTPAPCGPTVSPSPTIASTAAANTRPGISARPIASAPTPAGPPLAEPPASTMRLAPVSDAGDHLSSTVTPRPSTAPVRVLRVIEKPPASVYNLTVHNPDGEGEYFANGVLVHNCDEARYAVCYVDKISDKVPTRVVMGFRR